MKSSRTDWSSAARIRNDAEKGSGAVVADIDILLQRATAGDVTAAWQYGYARLVGEFEHSVKGVIRCRRNRREALKWLEYAAKNGCSGAMLELGAYWSSIGGKSASDRRLALLRGLQWEKKAWCAGEVVAATNIAVTYSLLGEYRRSYLWLRKAYAQSPWAARLLLAEAYMKGMGVKRDIGKARRLCEELMHDDMASECERESAFEYLKRLSGEASDVMVRFVVASADIALDELIRLYDATPTRKWKMGDLIQRGRKTVCVKNNGFEIESNNNKTSPLPVHLLEMQHTFADMDINGERLDEKNGKYDAEFRIGIDFLNGKQYEMMLNNEFFHIACKAKASIDVDVLYLDGDDWEEMDPYVSTVKAMQKVDEIPRTICEKTGRDAFDDVSKIVVSKLDMLKEGEVEFVVKGESPIVCFNHGLVSALASHGQDVRVLFCK